MVPVHLDYINNGKIVAIAFEEDGRGFIGFAWGAIVILGDLFNRMMRNPKFMPAIGDAEAEDFDSVFHDGIPIDARSLRSRKVTTPTGELWASLPRDPTRQCYAELCRIVALNFALIHELAHIGYGHGRYLASIGATPYLIDAPFIPAPRELQVTRQALEMNADAFGASISLSALLNRRFELMEAIPLTKAFLQDEKQVAYLWITAVYSLFRVFGRLACTIDEILYDSHLPLAIRAEGNINCGMQIFFTEFPALRDCLPFNLRPIEGALQSIGAAPSCADMAKYEALRADPRLDEHVRLVVRRFQDLKSDLERYSHYDFEVGTPPEFSSAAPN
jgi:hypothetical protein